MKIPTARQRRWAALAAVALLPALIATPRASADTPLTPLPGGDLSNFVKASTPAWFFSNGASGHKTCWPAKAIFNSGTANPGADVRNWPDSDSGCPPIGKKFPTYTGVRTCFDTEVRVSFTLYFPKDGFKSNGHRHDFERAIVIWRYAGNNQWVRWKLLLSSHGDWHVSADWSKVESQDTVPDGNFGRGLDHPRVYVGFGKHALFNNQGGLTDVLSSISGLERRHADYPGYSSTWFVPVTDWPGDPLGALFKYWASPGSGRDRLRESHWGQADSNPFQVYRDLCHLHNYDWFDEVPDGG